MFGRGSRRARCICGGSPGKSVSGSGSAVSRPRTAESCFQPSVIEHSISTDKVELQAYQEPLHVQI